MLCTPRKADTRFRLGGLRAALAICLGAVAGISDAAAQASDVPAQDAPGVVAEVRDGRLSLQAEGASLAVVLRAIGEAGSFGVRLRGELAEPVRQSFTDQPLEDAIRRLVGAHSLILIRGDPLSGESATGLAEIRVTANRSQVSSDSNETKPSASAPGVISESDADDRIDEQEAYRQAVLDYRAPTSDEILFELYRPDPAARMAAVPKVGSMPPHQAIDIISYIVSYEEDASVRSRAVAALTRLRLPDARALLRDRALGDHDPAMRMQALNALASSTGERSVNILGRALRQDAEAKVRITAVRALGRVGGDWARAALRRAIRDADPEISLAAGEALAAWPSEE